MVAFLFCSSQNLDRVVSAYRAALQSGTTLVIDLYTAYVLRALSKISSRIPQFDWRGIRVMYWKNHAERLVAAGEQEFLYAAAKSKIEIEEICEKRKSILALVRNNSLFEIMAGRVPEPQAFRLIWSQWAGFLTEEYSDSARSGQQALPSKLSTSTPAATRQLMISGVYVMPCNRK